MFIGIAMFLVLMIMGGVIAFLGDKIGTKVGKRRMTLFGLRPKYTSIIVTIIAGVLISFLTIAALAIANENVRVALFGLNQLHQEMAQLTEEVKVKNIELQKGKTLLSERNEELKKVEEQQARMHEQLLVVQQAYEEAKQGVATSEKEIRALQQLSDELNGNIQKLDKEKEFLLGNVHALREGRVIFRSGQVLTSVVVDEGLDRDTANGVLGSILNDINGVIKERMTNAPADANYVQVLPEDFNEAVEKLIGSKQKKLIRIVAAQNLIVGDQLVLDFDIHPSLLIFHEGESVMTENMEKYRKIKNYDLKVVTFLKDLNKYASERGVLADPITGEIGSLDGQELREVIQEVKANHGKCALEVIAKRDIYTNGPLLIDVKVHRL